MHFGKAKRQEKYKINANILRIEELQRSWPQNFQGRGTDRQRRHVGHSPFIDHGIGKGCLTWTTMSV